MGRVIELHENGTWTESGVPASGDSSGKVAPVTTKPDPFASLGTQNQSPAERQISAGEAVSVEFTVEGDQVLRVFGKPGSFFKHVSWGIFDSSGARVLNGDNQTVVGSLGYAIDKQVLGQLPQGATYTYGVRTDGTGNAAFQIMPG